MTNSSLMKPVRGALTRIVRAARSVRRVLKILKLKIKGCQVDWSAIVHPSAVIELSGGSVSIGARTHIDRGAILRAMGGRIEIGDDCSVNAYSFLSGGGGLRIGDHVMIASHVSMYASNHVFQHLEIPMNDQGLIVKGIEIERDVWVGTGVRVLDGVRIGHGSVLAAGAVVTQSTEPFSINGGVPARKIGTRDTGGQLAASAPQSRSTAGQRGA